MSLNLTPVFCNEKHMANYAYILHDSQTNEAAIIDAAESRPILQKLEELKLTPSYILTTHHHFDHVEGNIALKEKFNLKIIAPEYEFDKIPGADISAKDASPISLGFCEITPILTPGHTQGHVVYYIPKENYLFTGDVLFNLCIGGLFEGTAEEMFNSLQKIKNLPNNTHVFPGHEYTRSCLSGICCPPTETESYIQKMLIRENGGIAPVSLQEEKRCNPYLQAQTLKEFLG